MVATRRNKRRLLWAACVAAAAGTAACLYGAIFLGPASEPVTPTPPSIHAAGMSRPALGPLADYAVIWQKNFRPPPPAPTQASAPGGGPPAPPGPHLLGVTLIGTASDATASFGLFREATGQIKCIGVGQTVGGARVIRITDGAATVQFGNEIITLTVVKSRGKQ